MGVPVDNALEIIFTRRPNAENVEALQEYIEILEGVIIYGRDGAVKLEERYPDGIYDTCMEILEEVYPESKLFKELWTEDADVQHDDLLDKYLDMYPMCSIATVKSLMSKAYLKFKASLPAGTIEMMAGIKLNGHGIRLTYLDGFLKKGHSRGRHSNGRDLTRQCKLILGEYNEALADKGLVEIRAEALVSFENYSKLLTMSPGIKSPFSAVAATIKESATAEETSLLSIVCYDIISEQVHCETLEDKYLALQSFGFEIPLYHIVDMTRKDLDSDVNDLIYSMSVLAEDYAYYSDGVVLAINNLELFNELGADETTKRGNIALKMGYWAQSYYVGIVKEILWEQKKSKKTPVALLEEPVITASGAKVDHVPLYAPCYVLMLEVYEPGSQINFKFGGESGVVPLTKDGRLVTDPDGEV